MKLLFIPQPVIVHCGALSDGDRRDINLGEHIIIIHFEEGKISLSSLLGNELQNSYGVTING